jgi:glycosyltransferase involved in cell wall biosynthesis/predicted metal-dependent phosphoesterase TrpH
MVPTTSIGPGGSRADLHCHSTASQVSKLGIQRSAGLPECATPPEQVYELAKRRGMDFVTITDHDTIDGALEIAHLPDVFISEELTAWFRGEDQAVHILCLGINPQDHEWLQRNSRCVESCAEYLHANHIACALAHPFYAVEAPLTPHHRRRLARLFEIWEVRNGSRAPELNMPAAVYIETHGGTGVAGSDDHAGVDIGRTFTRTPASSTPEEFLAHIRAGRAEACGEQGSAAKWAHAALALAARSLPESGIAAGPGQVEPAAVLRLSERVVSQGSDRTGEDAADFTSTEARALLDLWLAGMGISSTDELIELLQSEGFSHAELQRRARAVHDAGLAAATQSALSALRDGEPELADVLGEVFAAIIPVVPYAPAATFLAGEKLKLADRDSNARRGRVALVVDSISSTHGVSHTIERIRELRVPGYDVEVIGTDPGVDRRLPAVAEVEVPFYEGMGVGVPSLPALVETLADGRYEMVHVVAPGPAGIAAALLAKIAGTPVVASHHTDLVAYAGLRSGDDRVVGFTAVAMAMFYAQAKRVLSPSVAADEALAQLGVDAGRIGRWVRGVDTSRFDPALRDRGAYPGEISVLYAGRLSREKGAELLADAFLRAHERDPRLHLLLAGGGPEQEWLAERLGATATFLGWLHGDALPRAYASADMFLFPSITDTYGQVVVEAQASGLPVIAANVGGPVDLIADGVSGLLRDPDPDTLAGAINQLANEPLQRRRLAVGGVAAAGERSWDAALEQLAAGYDAALGRERVAPAPAPTPTAPTLIRAA